LAIHHVGSIVISPSRGCLQNDEGQAPKYFFLEPPLGILTSWTPPPSLTAVSKVRSYVRMVHVYVILPYVEIITSMWRKLQPKFIKVSIERVIDSCHWFSQTETIKTAKLSSGLVQVLAIITHYYCRQTFELLLLWQLSRIYSRLICLSSHITQHNFECPLLYGGALVVTLWTC